MSKPLFDYAASGGSERLLLRRRVFLQSLLAGAGMLAVQTSLAELLPPGGGGNSVLADALEEAPWPLLAAVQSHLFPSEAQAPGAREINALGYLQRIFAMTDRDAVEDRKFIVAGATWLRKRVAIDHKGLLFSELDENEREAALRRMARSKDGENWITLVLYYILEALLGDPIYGGNTNEVGWRWLGYTAGFPRPPQGKRYYELKRS